MSLPTEILTDRPTGMTLCGIVMLLYNKYINSQQKGFYIIEVILKRGNGELEVIEIKGF